MKGKRVMVVAAHPDDADFYCGGTVARWAAEGAQITYLICTDGALGADTDAVTMDQVAALRRAEQHAANAALGVRETIYLGYPDMSLAAGEELRLAIARRFREQGAYVLLLTNGLLLARQAAEAAASVDEVIVSLDGGTAATYAAIRGIDGLPRVLDGIRAVRAGGVPVVTRTTLQRQNFREMPAIIQAAREAGANRISFLTVDVSSLHAFGPRFTADAALTVVSEASDPAAPALSPAEVAEFAQVIEQVIAEYADAFASGLIAESPDKLRRMVQYFAALNGDGAFPAPRCNAPHTSVVVEVDGTLRPCYFLPAFGRLGADALRLSQAVNLPTAQALRQAYRAGQRAECERCVCPLYKGPRALLRM